MDYNSLPLYFASVESYILNQDRLYNKKINTGMAKTQYKVTILKWTEDQSWPNSADIKTIKTPALYWYPATVIIKILIT